MCRSVAHGGRRCPCHSDPYRRAVASATQRMSRYARWADAASDAGDAAAASRYDALMMKAVEDLDRLRAPEDLPPVRTISYVPEQVPHTLESTQGWDDGQWAAALNAAMARGDQAEVDELAWLMDQQQSAEPVSPQETRSHAVAMGSYRSSEWVEPSALTDLSARPSRRVSAREAAREQYESYVDCQWMQAEADCRGTLLNAEGYRKGIDSRSLFSGSAARAEKYASEELLSWWSRYGRLNFAAFRYQALGWESDKDAAARNRAQQFSNAAAW